MVVYGIWDKDKDGFVGSINYSSGGNGNITPVTFKTVEDAQAHINKFYSSLLKVKKIKVV
jgi:hypothetical protein